ncbi:MAG: DUF4040 domain-containing protein, partial [Syntrophomonas sp.]|nr:DUF4040 domain-containing protein [Syntrophomonas sp.]
KELFFTGVLNASRLDIFQMETWGQLFPILAWIASTFTFVYCLIFVTKTFLGKYRPQKLEKKPREVSWGMILPPLLLAVLVVLFFFFPNEVAGFLLFPAIASILPGFIDSGPGVVVISAWHGWTPELLMTLGVVIAGSILFAVVRGRSDFYRRLPEQFSLNFLYDRFLVRSTEISFSSINAYMTGVLRHYLLYILAFLVLVLGVGMWRLQCFAFTPGGDSPVSLYEIILALVLIVAGLVVLCSRNRLSAIIGMGVMGYIVVMFFVIFRAPDLALTQLVVETFTVVLFLLCFHFLPKMAGHMEPLAFRAGNLIVSLAVGALVTVAVLTAQSSRSFAPISQFYTEKAYELAGGKNIVNTILVDFRGFDTMLEILVLCMAGLGVYTLISIRCAMGDDDENP